MYKMLIVKFGEAFLKSKSTKRKFIQLLIDNLKLKWVKSIKFKNAYLEIYDDVSPKLVANTFWVYKVEIVDNYDFPDDFDLDNLDDEQYAEYVLNEIFKKVKNKLSKWEKFRLSVVRENKSFPFNSLQIQTLLGKKLEKEVWAIADYKNYNTEIKIRILKSWYWIWSSKDEIKGLGWLPYWIEWKALSLFSWWIDSPVATFLAAKRWVRQDFLFLNIPDSDLLLAQNYKIYEFLKSEYWIFGKFYQLKVKKYIQHIKQKIPEWLRQIIFKIFLYKISSLVSSKFKIDVLINWENLGQVSTQTLTNLTLLNKVTDKFIIRPLVCFDKVEIIDLAKKIWTYDLSIQIKETCSLEKHSNSRIKKIKEIFELYNSLWFNEEEIVKHIELISSLPNFDFYKLKVSEPKGELINLDEICDFKPSKDKTYTFTCSSWYKASQVAYEWYKKWYNTYWL